MVEGQLNQSDSQESTSVPCSKVASDLRNEQLRQKEAIQGMQNLIRNLKNQIKKSTIKIFSRVMMVYLLQKLMKETERKKIKQLRNEG